MADRQFDEAMMDWEVGHLVKGKEKEGHAKAAGELEVKLVGTVSKAKIRKLMSNLKSNSKPKLEGKRGGNYPHPKPEHPSRAAS